MASEEGATQDRVQHFGPLTLDLGARDVRLDGNSVELTRSEFALLAALASQPGVARSNRELLTEMWGGDWLADTSALQVHISRLRRKLGESAQHPRFIITVFGFGYRFDPALRTCHGAGSVLDRVPPADGEKNDDPRAFFVASTDEVLEWVSGGVDGVVGWRAVDLVGTRTMDLLHPDDARLMRPVEDLMGVRDGWSFRGRLRGPDGAHVVVDIFSRPTFDDDGDHSGFIGEIRPAVGNGSTGDR